MGFRSLISDFSSRTATSRFCDFPEKSAFLKDFVRKCTSNMNEVISKLKPGGGKLNFFSFLNLGSSILL